MVGAAIWLVGGAMVGFGVAALPSIGWFVIVGGAVVLTLATVHVREGWAWVFLGAALPLLWVAATHRRGPGTVCGQTDSGGWCSEFLDPLPWLAAGLVLVALFGVARLVTWWCRARARRASDARSREVAGRP